MWYDYSYTYQCTIEDLNTNLRCKLKCEIFDVSASFPENASCTLWIHFGPIPTIPLERTETRTTDKKQARKEYALCRSLQQDSKHMRPIYEKAVFLPRRVSTRENAKRALGEKCKFMSKYVIVQTLENKINLVLNQISLIHTNNRDLIKTEYKPHVKDIVR